MILKNKAGIGYVNELTIFIIIYGVSGYVNNVHTSVWDRLFEVTNNTIKFDIPINMNNHNIKGITDGVENLDAINVKQLNEMESIIENHIKAENDKLKLILESLINKKQNKSYYEVLFGNYYFDCLDPNMFNISQSSYDAFIEKINDKLVLSQNKILNEFNIETGLNLLNSYINLDRIYTDNDNFTFIVFKHNTSIKLGNSFSFRLNSSNTPTSPFPIIKDDNFLIYFSKSEQPSQTLLSTYKNKELMLWFTKHGNVYQLNLCNNGGLITKTLSSPQSFQANRIKIIFRYEIQRIGFSPNLYVANGPEFHKILFLEKSRGTFFQ